MLFALKSKPQRRGTLPSPENICVDVRETLTAPGNARYSLTRRALTPLVRSDVQRLLQIRLMQTLATPGKVVRCPAELFQVP